MTTLYPCTRCHGMMPADAFPQWHGKRRSWCKECLKAYLKSRRKRQNWHAKSGSLEWGTKTELSILGREP